MTRRQYLKDRLAHAHEEAERQIGEIETRDDYLRYLAGVVAFRVPTEEALAELDWPQEFGNWRPVQLASCLREDVEACGVGWHPGARRHAFNGVADLFGILYVIEGAGLGAKLIYKKVERLGLDDRRGARHLARQAGSVGSWRDFVEKLEAAPSLDLDKTLCAAQSMFRMARFAFGARR